MLKRFFATLKELRRVCDANGDATPSELRLQKLECAFPRVAKTNPWLEFANAFIVIKEVELLILSSSAFILNK